MKTIKYEVNGTFVEVEVSDEFARQYEQIEAEEARQIWRDKKRKDSSLERMVEAGFQVADPNSNIEEKLLENKEAPVEEKMNMVDIFEEQFGRPLTPMEFDSIKEWVQSGYSEEIILKALKEAVKSQVLTLRYIEGILINWAQNGVKERYIDEKPQERKVKESHYHWWEDE